MQANKASKIVGLILLTVTIIVEPRTDDVLYQPSMDLSFLKDYFRNDRLVDLQMKCLFRDDGPCDFVGRWMKRSSWPKSVQNMIYPIPARMADGLLGICRQCSASQTQILAAIIDYLKTNRPDFYEKAVRRFLTEDKLLKLIKMANTAQVITTDGGKGLERRHVASLSPPRNSVTTTVPPRNTTRAPWEDYINALTMPANSSFSFPILPY